MGEDEVVGVREGEEEEKKKIREKMKRRLLAIRIRRRRLYLPVTSKTVFNLDERLRRISRRSDGRSIYHGRRAKLEL